MVGGEPPTSIVMTGHHELSFSEPFAEPLRAAQIMIGFPHPWCICGGWAIDLFVNRVSRQHKDVDIAIGRRDQLALRSHFVAQGWALEKAVDGQLAPWMEGEFIELPVHTIWCKNPNVQPDFVEVLFNEVNKVHPGHEWLGQL